MIRTVQSVRILQAVAVIAGLAVLLWSLGLPSLRFADAASLTSISDTLSDSAPSVVSNHTITFTLPDDGTPLAGGDTITITFTAASFDLSNVNFNDFDFATGSQDLPVELQGVAGAGDVGVATTSNTITFTLGASLAIATGTTINVEIGTNASFDDVATGQIVNPAVGTYDIDIATSNGGTPDTGATIVVILQNVEVTANVDTTFTFTVAGAGPGDGAVDGENITGTTTPTTIPFGTLASGTATVTAQILSVSTNASQGFTVTVQADSDLQSSTGGVIDAIEFADSPTAWTMPTVDPNDEMTWGMWGVTSEDTSIIARGSNFTGATSDYVGVSSSTPVAVMGHNGPADGTTAGIGQTRVGYKVEITDLQEAGDDYSTTLTYVATPVF